jgi:DNA-binding transcriptional MerR regulator
MSASALPSKLFFRIGEVASLVGVEPHVLRYWEREFRSIRPTKSAKGQRVYSRKDVENLLRVRDLLYRDGFTIAGAKKRLQRGPSDEASPVSALVSGDREIGETEIGETEIGESEAEREDDEDLEAEDDAVSLEPESGPRAHAEPPVREKLTALRAEVERFLEELGTDPQLETEPHERA